MLRDSPADLHNGLVMLDWNDLHYFLAVAKSGSTIAAAKALGVNQSTVARRLRALEETLEFKLFERRSGGYRLTREGEQLLPHVERVGESVSSVERQILSRDKSLTGTLRVTCPAGIGAHFAPLLSAFRAMHPGLNVALVVEDRILDLAKGEAEVAIRVGDLSDSVLVGRKIGEMTWAFYATPGYIERHGRPASFSALEQHRIVGATGDGGRWLAANVPAANIVVNCNNVSASIITAKSGIGLALIPVPRGNAEPELVRVSDDVPGLATRISLLTHPDLRRTPRVDAFFEFVTGQKDIFNPQLPLDLGASNGTGAG
jgi:DNA-binding transcriptional LysR family regulator